MNTTRSEKVLSSRNNIDLVVLYMDWTQQDQLDAVLFYLSEEYILWAIIAKEFPLNVHGI